MKQPTTAGLHQRLLLLYLGFIYLTLPLLPVAVKWIRSSFGSAPITVFGPLLPAGLAAWLLFTACRRGSADTVLHVLTLVLASVMVLVYKRQNPVEQVHLVEYGLAGFLAYRASGHRPGSSVDRHFVLWAGIALASGIVDELIQAILPNRVCDVTDMVANVVSVIVGLDVAATHARVRPAGDRRAGDPAV